MNVLEELTRGFEERELLAVVSGRWTVASGVNALGRGVCIREGEDAALVDARECRLLQSAVENAVADCARCVSRKVEMTYGDECCCATTQRDRHTFVFFPGRRPLFREEGVYLPFGVDATTLTQGLVVDGHEGLREESLRTKRSVEVCDEVFALRLARLDGASRAPDISGDVFVAAAHFGARLRVSVEENGSFTVRSGDDTTTLRTFDALTTHLTRWRRHNRQHRRGLVCTRYALQPAASLSGTARRAGDLDHCADVQLDRDFLPRIEELSNNRARMPPPR
mmetsp:Transcript_3648/g.11265  ORF Transcript_3648/g.11265 Transcript_3648/m.11265 type:complete len:281 (-) Transcript_3648:3754-4596(-)